MPLAPSYSGTTYSTIVHGTPYVSTTTAPTPSTGSSTVFISSPTIYNPNPAHGSTPVGYTGTYDPIYIDNRIVKDGKLETFPNLFEDLVVKNTITCDTLICNDIQFDLQDISCTTLTANHIQTNSISGVTGSFSGNISVGSISGATATFDYINARNLRNFLGMPMDVIDTFPRINTSSVQAVINGQVYLSYFFPLQELTISSLGVMINGTGQDVGGTSVRRLALFQPTTINGNVLDMIGRTAITNTLGSVSGLNSAPLDSAGGFPTSLTLVPNNQYVFSMIMYNTGGVFNPPQFAISSLGGSLMSDVPNRTAYRLLTQTDIPTSITLTNSERSNIYIFGRMSV